MSAILSICIPTYNRAPKLKKQLEKLVSFTERYADLCQIIISDNNSTDDTYRIIDAFKKKYPTRITSYSQSVNIGFVNNYRFLMNQVTSKYVWVLGDDDPIYNSIIEHFFDVRTRYTASIFHFNHRCITGTEEVIHESYYSFKQDLFETESGILFQKLATDHQVGGLMFISASIFETDVAKGSIAKWNGSKNNQAFPLYVAAFAAAQNGMYFVSTNELDCVYNESFWKEQQVHIFLHDVNEILVSLRKIGYSKSFILTQMKFNFYSNIGWKKFKQIIIRKPLYGLRILRIVSKII